MRSSLGHGRNLGKPYSMLSTERLNVPVMSKKRGNTFKANLMDPAAVPHEKQYDEETSSLAVSFKFI
jgi:hypothetical protein